MVPYLGTQLLNKHTHVETKVYFKPPNTGLQLHYKSHVNDRYKRGLLKLWLIVHLHFHPIKNWCHFSEECDRLKLLFFRLNTGYVGFTRRDLQQGVEELKNSSLSIGKHFRDKNSLAPKDLTTNFSALMKCTNKFGCLVYEFFYS